MVSAEITGPPGTTVSRHCPVHRRRTREFPLFTSSQILAHSAEGDGFHAPGLEEFFPPAIFFDGTPFEFNRIMLVRVIMAVALILLLWLATRRARLVPGRAQAAVEFVLDFVRVQIVEQILGRERGRRFTPMLTTIFFTIIAMNISGVIPGLNIGGTSVIGLPLLLALWVYVMYLATGVRKHGVVGYLKTSLFPSSVPWYMYPIVTPIEFLQVFLLRPATLALRLLANMLAGHLMLVLCFAGTDFLLFHSGGLIPITGVLAFAGGFGITIFEIFIALLQAYIFTLLAAIYLNMAQEEEH